MSRPRVRAQPERSDWETEKGDPNWCDPHEPALALEETPDLYDARTISQDVAGQEFYELLVHLKDVDRISAKDACVLAFWSCLSKGHGRANELMYRPDAQPGHFSERVDRVTHEHYGNDAVEHYELQCPGHLRRDSSRVVLVLPTMPLHEASDLEWAENIHTCAAQLKKALEAKVLPPCYYEHIAVRNAPPDTLYLDGIKFTRHDTVLGLFWYCVLRKHKDLVAALRKAGMCKCGCRGWCSIFSILSMFFWSLLSLVTRIRPSLRHDDRDFDPVQDAGRLSFSGTEMPVGDA